MKISQVIRYSFLAALAVMLAAVIGLGLGHRSHTAEAVNTLTVGLDMKANENDAGTYGATLPTFEKCLDVNTTTNSFFYIDVFVLNVTNLVAFTTDLEFTSGKMQIMTADVKQMFGSSAYNTSSAATNPPTTIDQNGIVTPPVSNGAFQAGGFSQAGGVSGSGVLVRIKAQAFINTVAIPFKFSTQISHGVTLTDVAANHPGDTSVPKDGLFDGPFVNATGTIQVNQPDTDGDGVTGCDNCPNNSNSNQADTDKDGVGDACDPDIDNDGICNTGGPLSDSVLGTPPGGCVAGASGADNCPYVPNANQDPNACLDSDGDTVLNGIDNCPNVANGPAQANVANVGNQSDREGDGVGDACDPDSDNDGICNTGGPLPNGTLGTVGGCVAGASGTDNCRYAANFSQANWNNDSLGDACQDSDSDGILDSVDNCRSLGNNNQSDSDHDGVGDPCDNCPNAANATQADFNNNFVGDACDDSDSDGWTDAVELFTGTKTNQRCAATLTPKDENPDSVPTDNNDDRKVNTSDILAYTPVFNTTRGGPPGLGGGSYAARYDLNMDNRINLSDILKFAPTFNATATCTYP